MPRPEKPVDAADGPVAAFAVQLRATRRAAGLTYRQMSKQVHYSVPTLSSAAAGRELPSWAVTWAYVSACGIPENQKEVWEGRWREAHAGTQRPARTIPMPRLHGQSNRQQNLDAPAMPQQDHPTAARSRGEP